MIWSRSFSKSATYSGSISLVGVSASSCKVSFSPGRALKPFCQSGSAAFIGPPARAVLPPSCGNFSRITTFLSCCRDRVAAARPAPPAPMTTTSVSYSSSLAAEEAGLSRFFHSSASPPASLIASATPSITPCEEIEAPETASTFKVCPSMIAFGRRLKTSSAIPLVSPAESTVMSATLSFSMVTSIGINDEPWPLALTL